MARSKNRQLTAAEKRLRNQLNQAGNPPANRKKVAVLGAGGAGQRRPAAAMVGGQGALAGQRIDAGIPVARIGRPLAMRGAQLTYQALGSTDQGREWSLLALHPCGEYVTTADGIPDESQANSVTPGYRGQSVIGWNANLFATPPSPTGDFQYDVQLVVLPHSELDYVYRIGYQGTWSKWVFIHGATFQRNATSPRAVTLDDSGMSAWRLMGRGLTVHLIAPTLADQGQLVAGQIKPVVIEKHVDFNSQKDNAGTQTGEGDFFGWGYYVPHSEMELVQQDPLAAQWDARKGCYIPMRFIQPVQLYADTITGTTQTGVVGDGSALGAQPSTGIWMLTAPSATIEGGGTDDVYNPTATWTENTFLDVMRASKMDWGVSRPGNQYSAVSFFLGISNQATLQVKTRTYIQAEVVGVDSPAAPFTHKSPLLDRAALDIVTKVGQVQEHVFLAKDNDLGSILASVGKILPGIIAPIGDLLAGSGIPIAQDIGRVGAHLARKVAGFF